MQIRVQHLKGNAYMLIRPVNGDEREQLRSTAERGEVVVLKLGKGLVDRMIRDLSNKGENNGK